MDTGADQQPERAKHLGQGDGAADGTGRPIEEREEPVASGSHLSSAIAPELIANASMMRMQEIGPGRVTKLCRSGRGSDDIGEQDGRQDPIRLGASSDAGKKLLDLPQDRVGVADPWQMVIASQVDEPRVGDVVCQIASGAGVDDPVAAPVEDQGWYPDR